MYDVDGKQMFILVGILFQLKEIKNFQLQFWCSCNFYIHLITSVYNHAIYITHQLSKKMDMSNTKQIV